MTTIIFGVLAGAATFLGMFLILAREQWARRNSVYLIAFAIGILLTTSLTEIIPEAVELTPHAFFIVLGTFYCFYLLEHSVIAHHHHLNKGSTHTDRPIEKLAFVGLSVHSLIDGLAIGAGFEVSSALGIIATLAVILHEVPEGITVISLFLHAGYRRRHALGLSAIVALATPLGAVVTLAFPSLLTEAALGTLLAIAGGSFLFVAAAELIPETHHAKHIPVITMVTIGIIIPFVIERLL